ncbi:MAG: hypothetical protein ABSE41_10370 [Bacteroidota bacterium]|jgi:hypothetical protein
MKPFSKRGKPYAEVDEKSHIVLETSEERLTQVLLDSIETVRRIWRFLESSRLYARPGWWTLKRWVEFMWFRKEVA